LLEEDNNLPSYPLAKVARFAPLSGQQAAIVDELGIHFVDMSSGQETLQIANPGIECLKYSPCDSYIITCEKFDPKQPTANNLGIWCAKTGKMLAQFNWTKSPSESLKSVIFTPDESICLRLVPHSAQGKEPNFIEVYKNGDFSKPAIVIMARQQQKAAVKGQPPIIVDS